MSKQRLKQSESRLWADQQALISSKFKLPFEATSTIDATKPIARHRELNTKKNSHRRQALFSRKHEIR